MKTHILCYSRESKLDQYDAQADMSIPNQVFDHFRILARDYQWDMTYEQYQHLINKDTGWCGQFEYKGFVIDFGSDIDISGKDLNRKELQRHIAFIKQGVVLEWRGKNDSRFIRNPREADDLLKMVKDYKVKWVWYQAPEIVKDRKSFEIHTMVSGFMIGDGRKHFKDLARRKIDQKMPMCNPPIGYLMKDKNFVQDKKNAQAVRRVFEMALAGKNVAEIASSVKFDKTGSAYMKQHKDWAKTPHMKPASIRNILRNKVYAGFLNVRIWDEWRYEYEDIEYRGSYEPIVTLSEFEAVQKKK